MEPPTASLLSTPNNAASFSPARPALQVLSPFLHLSLSVPVPDWVSSRASHSSRARRCSSLIPAQGKGFRSQIWVGVMEWGGFLPSDTAQYTLGLYFLFSKENPNRSHPGHRKVYLGNNPGPDGFD